MVTMEWLLILSGRSACKQFFILKNEKKLRINKEKQQVWARSCYLRGNYRTFTSVKNEWFLLIDTNEQFLADHWPCCVEKTPNQRISEWAIAEKHLFLLFFFFLYWLLAQHIRFKVIFNEIGVGDKKGFLNKYSDYEICYGDDFSSIKKKKLFHILT